MVPGSLVHRQREKRDQQLRVGPRSRRDAKDRLRERRITGRGSVGKSIVHGLLERGNAEAGTHSTVRATVVPTTEAESIVPEIVRNVERGSNVYTDSGTHYAGLSARDYWHRWIDHGIRYVLGRVHVNGLENFWSLLKRALRGTYVAVAPFHLFRYVDEEAWRFNERKKTDGERFAEVMRAVLGKRITYRRLCAIGGSGFMGIP